jgi:hypothetical protein
MACRTRMARGGTAAPVESTVAAASRGSRASPRTADGAARSGVRAVSRCASSATGDTTRAARSTGGTTTGAARRESRNGDGQQGPNQASKPMRAYHEGILPSDGTGQHTGGHSDVTSAFHLQLAQAG